jgi:hypothetical protein
VMLFLISFSNIHTIINNDLPRGARLARMTQ